MKQYFLIGIMVGTSPGIQGMDAGAPSNQPDQNTSPKLTLTQDGGFFINHPNLSKVPQSYKQLLASYIKQIQKRQEQFQKNPPTQSEYDKQVINDLIQTFKLGLSNKPLESHLKQFYRDIMNDALKLNEDGEPNNPDVKDFCEKYFTALVAYEKEHPGKVPGLTSFINDAREDVRRNEHEALSIAIADIAQREKLSDPLVEKLQKLLPLNNANHQSPTKNIVSRANLFAFSLGSFFTAAVMGCLWFLKNSGTFTGIFS